MKKLNEILDNVAFEEIWSYMLFYYSDLKKIKGSYNNVFNFLLDLQPLNNEDNTIIYIDVVEDFDWNESDSLENKSKENEDTEYRVHAKDDNPEWGGYIDISFCYWKKWLGFYIEESVLKRFKIAEIIALCLYEMTWLGFDDESVKRRILNLENED